MEQWTRILEIFQPKIQYRWGEMRKFNFFHFYPQKGLPQSTECLLGEPEE